jgi:hypothetical protein
MNATTTQPMPAPPANPGPRVRCLIAIADTSLSAFEKLRLSEEAIAARPPARQPALRASAGEASWTDSRGRGGRSGAQDRRDALITCTELSMTRISPAEFDTLGLVEAPPA